MKNLFLLCFAVLSFSASGQIISGIYMGKLVNDSTGRSQIYELALNEYRGKISGYSYTTFVSNDSFYYSIKKIKAVKKDGQLIVQDDKMIINNFPEARAKKVYQTNYIQLTNEDTLSQMNGRWETNKTKIYYSIKGAMDLNRNADSSKSTLLAHLKELNLIENDNDQPGVTAGSSVKTKPAAKPQPVAAPAPVKLSYDQRANVQAQALEAEADSLVLAFYDNGVVDGDSVSVYVNGKNLVSSVRLTTSATKITIRFDGSDKLRIQLVAENLGSLPPNTGLLTIKDGEKLYQVNFSADLTTNAELIISRKKP
ncbi:MAG TPA: hypothetical protein VFR58_17825 [Flavisolibacter sp.]|nr:hypothetical protein [Flavisolibacter sp.]